MKYRMVAGSVVVGLGLSFVGIAVGATKPSSSCKTSAQNPPATQPAPQQPPATQPAPVASAVPVNKKCPVSGEAGNPKGKTVVYKGKTIGFCCDDCIELFNKNPEKYADKIK